MGNQSSFDSERKVHQSVNKVKQVLSPLSPRKRASLHPTTNPNSAKRRLFTDAPPTFVPWLEPLSTQSAYSFNDFVIHHDECLGEGSFACVKLATHLQSRKKLAVKVITKSKIPSELRKYAINEPKYLRCISHANIIKNYLTCEDADHIYMFLEYAKGGDLYSLVEKKGQLPEDLTRRIIKQVLHALQHCHENNVCHRDIKLENILYSGDESNIKVKLIDFGFASIIPCEDYKFKDFPGSMLYAAPELLEGTPYNARKSDIYSLGVLLYVMLYGRYPFFSESNVEILRLITQTTPEFDPKFSPSSSDLLCRMLTSKPSERISLQEIFEHPWLNKEKDSLASPLKTKVNLLKTEVAKHSQNLRHSLSPKTSRRNK